MRVQGWWLAVVSLCLSACGGQFSGESPEEKSNAAAFAPAAPNANIKVFSGRRENYLITRISLGYVVSDLTVQGSSVTVREHSVLQFADVRVNLAMATLASTIPETDLNALLELYIAFFRRVPDADGLAFWIGQVKAGQSIDAIAEHFYQLALRYADETGYSADMSDDAYIKHVYHVVLERHGSATPTDAEIKYWRDQLKTGASRGSLVRKMLAASRQFVGDLSWAWVPRILENKLQAASYFAVRQGMTYNDVVQGMNWSRAILAAVDVLGTSKALALMPSRDMLFDLQAKPSYTSVAGVCTPSLEKSWVRAHLDEQYLWYKEIVETDSQGAASPSAYFDALLVKSKDKFSFTAPQAEVDAYFGSGKNLSYGYTLLRQGSRLRILYVEPNSPAALAGLKRGDTLTHVDGTSLAQVANDVQYAALYPSKAETHQFQVADISGATRTLNMTAASVVKSPVLVSKVLHDGGRKLGYLLFNDHITTAETPLIEAMTQFRDAAVDDVVLDLRYNGGGYLYIANEVAAMIGGERTANKVFERLLYNDKSTLSPAVTTAYFYQYSTQAVRLPWLNLPRLFVLTGNRTCSASESIINGLNPFVKVILIGDATCGKPYGFRQRNNCNTAYFAIQFSGVNALEKGDYVEGFAPTCQRADDLDHGLGEVGEARLATALYFAKNGSCPAPSGRVPKSPAPPTPSEPDPYPWRYHRLVQ